MRKWIFLLVLSIFLSGMAHAGERRGTVTFSISLNAEENTETAGLWLPYPVSDEYQKIGNVRITGNFTSSAIYREPDSGALYLYAEWMGHFRKRVLEMSMEAEASERIMKNLKDRGGPVPAEVQRYLESNHFIPADGKVKEIAEGIVKDRKGILEKARAVYDWVVENTYRDPDVKGCGRGIVEQTLAKRGGKCADISSVYVALARAAGVPAREVFGIRLGKKDVQDITGGYHCWAEFYLPGTGWVPVDPSDVRKIMLVRKLDLEEATPYREYYFGAVDEFRIILERGGRGIIFQPPQKNRPLNYFMYPYAEVDGKALDWFDPKNFRYSVSFRAL